MKTVDQSFYFPRVPVAVIDRGATAEALQLRALLESKSAVVTLYQPGTPEDFLLVDDLLNGGPRAESASLRPVSRNISYSIIAETTIALVGRTLLCL